MVSETSEKLLCCFLGIIANKPKYNEVQQLMVPELLSIIIRTKNLTRNMKLVFPFKTFSLLLILFLSKFFKMKYLFVHPCVSCPEALLCVFAHFHLTAVKLTLFLQVIKTSKMN